MVVKVKRNRENPIERDNPIIPVIVGATNPTINIPSKYEVNARILSVSFMF
jgi:hypothetical protein